MSKKGTFACHGYSFEEFPDAFDMLPITDRANSLVAGIHFLFVYEKLLLPNTKAPIEITRARPIFYMLSDNLKVSLKINDFSLLTRRI